MKKFWEKAPIAFALVWIGVYVVALSAADSISEQLGTAKLITAPICIAMSGALLLWMGKNGLFSAFGLCRLRGKAADYLYFVPMAALISVNLWWGVQTNLSAAETVLFVISMLCVGFLEEIIFRGFLFNALRKDSLKRAVIISSVTFGFGHVVNLLSGADVAATLIQILYAVAAGFLFTVIYYKSGSLLPCIFTHSILNSLSVFSNEQDMTFTRHILSGGFLFVVAITYSIYILKKTEVQKK